MSELDGQVEDRGGRRSRGEGRGAAARRASRSGGGQGRPFPTSPGAFANMKCWTTKAWR